MRRVTNQMSYYSFDNYKPNKNAKPIMFRGTQYLSKKQAMVLNHLTRKEFEEYLNGIKS